MTTREVAAVILVSLDSDGLINWDFAEYYMKLIIKALEVIKEMEEK